MDSPLVQDEILDPLRRTRQPKVMAVHLSIFDYSRNMGINVEQVPFQLAVHNGLNPLWLECGKRRPGY